MNYGTKLVDKVFEKLTKFLGLKKAPFGNNPDALTVLVDDHSITVEIDSLIGNQSLAKQIEKFLGAFE